MRRKDMHCDELSPLVEKLADGECTESERARAEAHLAECESCQEHFRFIQALPEAGRKVPLPEPPGAYWDVLPRKVMARIEKEQSTQSSGGWFSRVFATPRLRWLGAVAAGVIAVVLSYEVLNLERERPLVTVRETAEEPVLEEAVPSEPSKAPLDAVTGEAEEPIDPDKFDVGGTPRRKRPSSTPPEAAAPTPASARKAAPTGTARALHESKKVKEGADIPESPEPAPTALVGAARVRARVESEDAPVAVLAEEMRKPVGAPAPPTAAPEVPKLEASEPAPRESSEHEGVVDEAGKLEKYAVMEQAARGRRGLNQVAFREEDRETTSASGNEAECRVLRDSLSPSMEVDEQEEIRYQLAKCSFRLYQSRQTEDDRRQAREDASAYLEIAPRGERADEIRELLDRIK